MLFLVLVVREDFGIGQLANVYLLNSLILLVFMAGLSSGLLTAGSSQYYTVSLPTICLPLKSYDPNPQQPPSPLYPSPTCSSASLCSVPSTSTLALCFLTLATFPNSRLSPNKNLSSTTSSRNGGTTKPASARRAWCGVLCAQNTADAAAAALLATTTTVRGYLIAWVCATTVRSSSSSSQSSSVCSSFYDVCLSILALCPYRLHYLRRR